MKVLWIFLILACVRGKSAQRMHRNIQISGCSESDKQYLIGNDGDEAGYSDFEKEKIVMTLPEFADPVTYGEYAYATSEQVVCNQILEIATRITNNPTEAVDPPQSSIYTKADVQLGSENTLICHVTGFFPPPVAVTWTKNNLDVTDSSALSRFYPNEDGTYNQFSHLRFTPQSGDVYSCTVQHKGLETPNTKTWEVDVSVPSVGPSVFCGVGLAAGLLGVATGTFFLIKGNQCN